jgi:hypothetical protein
MDDALRIAFEAGRPYTGLRGFTVDGRLWHYVPRSLAYSEGVIPVILVGNTLKLASSQPHPDLSAISSRFPNLKLEVVIAPSHEIASVLGADD